MNRTLSKQFTISILCFCLSSLSIAQLSDGQVRARANQFSIQLGQPATFQPPAVIRRGTQPGATFRSGRVSIQSREIVVTLDVTGNLVGYADMGAGRTTPHSGQDRFPSEIAVWAHVEQLLEAIGAPSELTRVKILRRGGDGSGAPSYLLRLEQRPNGYQAQSGNVVSCSVHRISGRLLSLHIGRGWTHEPSNIQITPLAAKETAARTLGGNAQDWNYVVQYWTSSSTTTAPQIAEMNSRKVMRLCYNLYCDLGSVIVDSVNGDMVWFGSPGNEHSTSTSQAVQSRSQVTGEKLTTEKSASKASANASNSESSAPRVLIGILIGIVVLFAGIQLWRRRAL